MRGADYGVHKVADTTVNWKSLREDFPILREQAHGHPLIYFDSAATSQKPRAVIEALRNFYEHENANVHRGLHTLSSRATEAYEKARKRVAEYIGAPSADEIIFTRGTTESINLVAQAWGGKFIHEGDVILLTQMEHHSNLVPWQLLAERTGAQVRFLPVRDDGTLALDQLSSLLTPQVKLFAFTHISNSLGTINPVAELCEKAHAIGAVTLVDAAQSAGHLPINVQELGCDFLAFSGHKMCGPTGIGVLVGFVMDAAHPHDLTTFADQYGLALRGGHHCNQPLMRRFGVSGTTRASFYFYNTTHEIDRMIEILHAAVRFLS